MQKSEFIELSLRLAMKLACSARVNFKSLVHNDPKDCDPWHLCFDI